MPSESAGQIAKQLSIPIYGIGAGEEVDGQLVIMHDIMGFYQPFRPWFAKCYVPEVIREFNEYLASLSDPRETGRSERKDGLLVLAQLAIEEYIKEVQNRIFPGADYSYPIKEAALTKLKQSTNWK